MGDNLRQLISVTSMVGAVAAETVRFHCSQFFTFYVMISVGAAARFFDFFLAGICSGIWLNTDPQQTKT